MLILKHKDLILEKGDFFKIQKNYFFHFLHLSLIKIIQAILRKNYFNFKFNLPKTMDDSIKNSIY